MLVLIGNTHGCSDSQSKNMNVAKMGSLKSDGLIYDFNQNKMPTGKLFFYINVFYSKGSNFFRGSLPRGVVHCPV